MQEAIGMRQQDYSMKSKVMSIKIRGCLLGIILMLKIVLNKQEWVIALTDMHGNYGDYSFLYTHVSGRICTYFTGTIVYR